VDQGGHGVYLFTDAPCAADIATRFLVTGALPARDRLCPGQSPLAATGTNRLIMRLPAGTV
ncbi:MAG TPA: alpha/beta hydrolase, partial [Pilimelia sp.]|nr:alpha/beta hydrolase [Pilimelia sp.]